MTLLLLVAGCISPSTFRLVAAILIMANMAWVADLAIFSVVAAWLMRSASSVNLHSLLEEDPSHTVSHSNYQEDESTLRQSHGQHSLGCRSRDFQRGCRLAHAFSFIGQFALIARGRPVTHGLAFKLPGGRVYASRIP